MPPSPERAAPPRLLVVARWPVGGIRTHLATNYRAVTAAGYACTFVGPADRSLDGLREAVAHLPGSELVAVPVRGRRCRLWSAVRAMLRGGRFALAHSHGMTAAAHTSLANLGRGVPHVVTLHEPLRAGQFPGLAGRLKRWLLAHALGRADAVITVSGDARANLLRHLPALRADRLHTVPNGIDASRYADLDEPVKRDLREELGLAPGVALVGYLGRFMPEKGFPMLLQAVRRLARRAAVPPFHVAAFGSGDYRREYQRLLERDGLSGCVTLLDCVPDVAPVLPQLDLVAVPSLWEASSLVSMEAMAAGVPVLGSDCPGLREVLRGTPARTARAGDAEALTRGLWAALREPWKQAARAFAPQARERFDNRHGARALTALYDGLLGRGAARDHTTLARAG